MFLLKLNDGNGDSTGPRFSSGSGSWTAANSAFRGRKVALKTLGDGSSWAAGAGIWIRFLRTDSTVETITRGLDK